MFNPRNVEAVIGQVLVLRQEAGGRCDIDGKSLDVGATLMQVCPLLQQKLFILHIAVYLRSVRKHKKIDGKM